MARVMRTFFAAIIALVFATVSLSYTTGYSPYSSRARYGLDSSELPPYTVGAETPFTYESDFSHGKLGVLNTSYWVVDPELISGAHFIENSMLRIESNNRFQVGFGMNWKAPTYKAGWENGSWTPWLPLFWNYHCEVTFVKPEVQWLIVENWIAWENGKSITAMVWYQHGSLIYSYGAFPNDGGYAVVLDRFDLPSEFNVTIDANYRAGKLAINWSNHRYEVPLQIEPIGTIPKPFNHFQITLMEPGAILIKKLNVVLS